MCNYYLQTEVIIRLFLMDELLVLKKIYVPLPPIEKGVNEAAENLTEEIYNCVVHSIFPDLTPLVEDLRLEIYIQGLPRYKVQLVEKREVYCSDLSNFNERIRYYMVLVERELVQKLESLSNCLYPQHCLCPKLRND